MKKVFAFLVAAGFVAANLLVMAQASVEPVIDNEDGGKVTCYSVLTHGGDQDVVKCYGCQNVLDAASYSGSDKCKP